MSLTFAAPAGGAAFPKLPSPREPQEDQSEHITGRSRWRARPSCCAATRRRRSFPRSRWSLPLELPQQDRRDQLDPLPELDFITSLPRQEVGSLKRGRWRELAWSALHPSHDECGYGTRGLFVMWIIKNK